MLAAESTLDDFVRSYRRDAAAADEAVVRVRAAFARVASLETSDPDIAVFVRTLHAVVRTFRPRVVVQTGTFVGISTLALAFALEDGDDGELFTIDPEPPSYFGVREPVAIARAAVAGAGLGHRVTFVRGYSTLALDGERMALPIAPLWRLGALGRRWDLAVIDGDHTFDGCLLDLEHAAEGLRPEGSGLIVVHDYLGIPDVRDAVRAWLRKRPAAETKVVPSPCGIALIRPGREEAA